MAKISHKTAYNYINAFENRESVKNLHTFGKSALFMLTAPTMPQEVRDQASELAEAGEDVSVKIIKQLKAEYAAKQYEVEEEKRRAQEFREESNERRKKIRQRVCLGKSGLAARNSQAGRYLVEFHQIRILSAAVRSTPGGVRSVPRGA